MTHDNATIEFIQKIQEMDRAGQEPKIIEIDGNKYIDKALKRIEDFAPTPLCLYSLDSLAQIIRAERVVYKTPLFVRVDSYKQISVNTTLLYDLKRDLPYEAEMPSIEPFYFNRYMEIESFIIGLRSKFVHTEDIDYITKLLSRVTNSDTVTLADDGVTQTVEAKQGVSLKQMVATKPIVELAPFRTFAEIDQPKSQFLFRLDKSGNAALFEADGGAWRLEAVRRIAEYLIKALDGVPNVTVLA